MPAPYPTTSVTATGAAAAATTVTLAAAAGVRHAVQSITVSCSGAAVTNSAPITLTVSDGATAIFVIDLILSVGVPVYPLPSPLMGTAGNAMTITTSAGPASSVVKISAAPFDYVPGNIPVV